MGMAFFSPDRDYTVTGQPSGYPGTFGLAPGKVTSSNRLFPIPNFGISRPLPEGGALALFFYANGGMNTDYHSPTFGETPTGVDLEQMFLSPTYAYAFFDHHAFGATAVFGYQRFAARGLAAFSAMSSDPAKLTDRGYANALGGGVRVGYQGRWAPWLATGVSYQSRTWMTKFGEYAGLFCEAGDFDIPSNWNAGIAVTPHGRLDLLADFQRTYYSEVHSVGHPLSHLAMAPLGLSGSAGFGWRDITTWKLGAPVRTGDVWTWRGGYSFGDQPVQGSEVLFNILAPGVIRQHASLGFTRALGDDRSVSAALTHAFSNRVSGPNPFEAPGQQRIELRMDEWELEVGYAWGIR
jgi:long-chain fatty acid transport protein